MKGGQRGNGGRYGKEKGIDKGIKK